MSGTENNAFGEEMSAGNPADEMQADYPTITCTHCADTVHIARNADGTVPTECAACQNIPARSCWNCGADFRPVPTEMVREYGARYCLTCADRNRARDAETAEMRTALADALHDAFVMHRGLAIALTRHGWAGHLAEHDFGTRLESAYGVALAGMGLTMDAPHSLPYFVAGRDALAGLASLTLHGAGAAMYFGHIAREDSAIPSFENHADPVRSADSIRDAIRGLWSAAMSITREMAEFHSYCNEYEESLEAVYSQFSTDDMPEIEPREIEWRVRVPVTVTVYADIVVTAADEDSASDEAQNIGVDYSDLDFDRYSMDIEPDWYSVEVEAN